MRLQSCAKLWKIVNLSAITGYISLNLRPCLAWCGQKIFFLLNIGTSCLCSSINDLSSLSSSLAIVLKMDIHETQYPTKAALGAENEEQKECNLSKITKINLTLQLPSEHHSSEHFFFIELPCYVRFEHFWFLHIWYTIRTYTRHPVEMLWFDFKRSSTALGLKRLPL